MRALLCFLISMALASPAVAVKDEMSCKLIVTVAAVSISGGAITTSQFPVSVRAGYKYPRHSYLMLRVDLVDASNGVSNLAFTFTESEADAGTFRNAVPLCVNAAPTLTCGRLTLDWDPQTHGKLFTLNPINWGYLFGKITVTPTGHGSGDTVAIGIYGCTE
jgi:hypothetical protein